MTKSMAGNVVDLSKSVPSEIAKEDSEFEMDTQEAQPAANTNFYMTSSQTCHAHCDVPDSDTPQGMDIRKLLGPVDVTQVALSQRSWSQATSNALALQMVCA